MRRLAVALLVWGLVGCGEEGEPAVDADAAPQSDAFCDQGWPHESWSTFGQGFLTTYCRACHGADTPDRYGAPPGVDFDTEEQALALADRILARTVGDDADMPPAGGPPPETLLRVRIWLECSIER